MVASALLLPHYACCHEPQDGCSPVIGLSVTNVAFTSAYLNAEEFRSWGTWRYCFTSAYSLIYDEMMVYESTQVPCGPYYILNHPDTSLLRIACLICRRSYFTSSIS